MDRLGGASEPAPVRASYAGRVNDELVYAHAGFGADAVPYLAGWDLQRAVHQRRADGEIADVCLMLEHEPVYTAGKRTRPADRPLGDPGAPVVEVDRGGKITWHGPGQLVGYPIIKLREPMDVVGYVRSLEEALIRTCAEFGVTAQQVAGRSGAWITGAAPGGPGLSPDGPGAGPGRPRRRQGGPGWQAARRLAGRARAAALGGSGGGQDRKVGAIGARVARGVTMHGFALNCDCDLSWFGRIVPCGISDAGVTTLSAEAGRRITVADALPVMERHLAEVLGHDGWRVVEGTQTLTGDLSPAAR